MGTKSAWTPERRAQQAERIRLTKPWEKSTGPKTAEGKAVCSRNACTPEAIREINERRQALMAFALELLGRKRRSK